MMSETHPDIESILPMGDAPQPVAAAHFPDRLHAFVWRNWHVVSPQQLAELVATTVDRIEAIAISMGLPPAQPIAPKDQPRAYITILRRNWHLLPYGQLLQLLDMSAEQLGNALKEDDFLWIKFGQLKPKCEPLHYAPPEEDARRRAAEIRAVVARFVEDDISQPIEPRFHFIRKLSEPLPPAARPEDEGDALFSVRIIYSFFAMFGDPLVRLDLDPFPDGLLQRLAAVGVNGVWLHVVLRDLAPGGDGFPEFGQGHETRLARLGQLVERAQRVGISVYLYLNEPRAMPAAFFRTRNHLAGVRKGEFTAMCTSDPTVRQWLADALTHVFQHVPDLGGVLTITASENFTSCASHGEHEKCPRCRHRLDEDIIAEVVNTIEFGVHRARPDAKVMAWDWGWKSHGDAPQIVERLNKHVWLISASEWSMPIERGGVKSHIGEYSMSAVGPGPRATGQWSHARKRDLKTMAKVQLNNTWELSSVPYLPVMDLVAEHCEGLARSGVNGLLLSWSLGGYPSPNLQIAERFSHRPTPSAQSVLDDLARERFGPDGAPHARQAWSAFSHAFRQYPYSVAAVYNCPVQIGPANLLHAHPTGYRATMTGFPYDDVEAWRGPYPADVFAGQFGKMATGWRKGLSHLETAVSQASPKHRDIARAELLYAQAAALHFQSVAHQARFIILRDRLAQDGRTLSAEQRQDLRMEIDHIIDDEIDLARQLFRITQQDSLVGFEAANQYFYLPLDLIEKIINCCHIRDQFSNLRGEAER